MNEYGIQWSPYSKVLNYASPTAARSPWTSLPFPKGEWSPTPITTLKHNKNTNKTRRRTKKSARTPHIPTLPQHKNKISHTQTQMQCTKVSSWKEELHIYFTCKNEEHLGSWVPTFLQARAMEMVAVELLSLPSILVVSKDREWPSEFKF